LRVPVGRLQIIPCALRIDALELNFTRDEPCGLFDRQRLSQPPKLAQARILLQSLATLFALSFATPR
jgi:hypothetical protein